MPSLARLPLPLTLALMLGACVHVPSAPQPPVAPSAHVRVMAPRWTPLPIEADVVALRPDSLILLSGASPDPFAIPTPCITRLEFWESGSQMESATRGIFFGSILGALGAVLLTPEPSLWSTSQLPMSVPVVAVGTALGLGIGYSRPGGTWHLASLSSVQPEPTAGGPPAECTPPAPPKKKPAVKPAVKK